MHREKKVATRVARRVAEAVSWSAFPGRPECTKYQQFDGVDGRVSVPPPSSPSYPFSFGGWVSSPAGFYLSVSDDAKNNSGVWVGIRLGQAVGILYTSSNGFAFLDGGAVGVDEWAHVVFVVRSATDRSVFLNGVETNETTLLDLPTNCDSMTIGGVDRVTQVFSEGKARRVFWSDVDLSSEITEIFNGAAPSSAHYYGPGCLTESGAVEDISGNGNHGVISGGVTTVDISTTLIGASWLANVANGGPDGPYLLDGGSYMLTQNVTAPGSAFDMTAPNVTLDLNGFSVIGFDTNPFSITNGKFDSLLSVGWDVTNAPGASRKTDSVYIDREASSAPNSLEWTIAAGATEYIEAGNVSLGNGDDLGVGLWMSEANGSSIVTASVGSESSVLSSNKAGTSKAGTISSTAVVNAPLRISIENPTASPITYYIDNVIASPSLLSVIDTDDGCSIINTSATRSSVSEGTERIDCDVIRCGSNFTADGEIDFIKNADSHHTRLEGLLFQAQNGAGLVIKNGVRFHSDSINIESRELNNGTLMYAGSRGGSLTVSDNPELGINGPQGAIYFNDSSDTSKVTITNNGFGKVGSRFTNGFLVTMRSFAATNTNDHVITGNSADFTGDANAFSRGIHIDNCDFSAGSLLVADNVLTLKEEAFNQEYSGAILNGCYVLQIEGSHNNITIRNNTLKLIGDYGGASLRLKDCSDVTIEDDNLLIVAADSFAERSSTLRIQDTDLATITVEDGIGIESNDTYLITDGGNTNTLSAFATHFKYVDAGSGNGPWYRANNGSGTFEFTNPTFEDAGSLARAKTAMQSTTGTGTTVVKLLCDFVMTLEESVGVGVGSGVAVTLKNSALTTVFTGTTDGSSQVSGTVTIFETDHDGTSGSSLDHEDFELTTDYGINTLDQLTLTDDYTPTIVVTETSTEPAVVGVNHNGVDGDGSTPGSADFTVDVPAGSNGDLILVYWLSETNNTQFFTEDVDFTQIFDYSPPTGTTDWVRMYGRIADGTEPAQYNFGDVSDGAEHRATVMRIENASLPSVFTNSVDNDGVPWVSPSAAVAVASSLALRFAHDRDSSVTFTGPALHAVEFEDVTTASGAGNGALSCYSKTVAPSSTGTAEIGIAGGYTTKTMTTIVIPPA